MKNIFLKTNSIYAIAILALINIMNSTRASEDNLLQLLAADPPSIGMLPVTVKVESAFHGESKERKEDEGSKSKPIEIKKFMCHLCGNGTNIEHHHHWHFALYHKPDREDPGLKPGTKIRTEGSREQEAMIRRQRIAIMGGTGVRPYKPRRTKAEMEAAGLEKDLVARKKIVCPCGHSTSNSYNLARHRKHHKVKYCGGKVTEYVCRLGHCSKMPSYFKHRGALGNHLHGTHGIDRDGKPVVEES